VETDRGGDITFHGPGQLVGYPIFDLNALKRDVKWYLEQVEESVVRAVAEFGIRAARSTGHTGVWVGDRKLCALGVRVQRWVTSHGFALNVNTDLEYFSLIIPCGLPDKGVTSMAEILARHVDFERVCEAVARNFGSVFDRRVTYEEPIAAERSQGEQTAAQVRTDADERT
jgi:lipoyl(octanoyl) transferase